MAFLWSLTGPSYFPPDPHYGGTGAVAHVEAVPRLFASQQGYALPRQRNVEPPVLRTAPHGARGKVSPGPLLSQSSRKTEDAFPPDPHYGGTGAVAHVEAVPSLCGQAPPQTSRPETLWSPLADSSGIVTCQTVWGQSDHSSVFQSP